MANKNKSSNEPLNVEYYITELHRMVRTFDSSDMQNLSDLDTTRFSDFILSVMDNFAGEIPTELKNELDKIFQVNEFSDLNEKYDEELDSSEYDSPKISIGDIKSRAAEKEKLVVASYLSFLLSHSIDQINRKNGIVDLRHRQLILEYYKICEAHKNNNLVLPPNFKLIDIDSYKSEDECDQAALATMNNYITLLCQVELSKYMTDLQNKIFSKGGSHETKMEYLTEENTRLSEAINTRASLEHGQVGYEIPDMPSVQTNVDIFKEFADSTKLLLLKKRVINLKLSHLYLNSFEIIENEIRKANNGNVLYDMGTFTTTSALGFIDIDAMQFIVTATKKEDLQALDFNSIDGIEEIDVVEVFNNFDIEDSIDNNDYKGTALMIFADESYLEILNKMDLNTASTTYSNVLQQSLVGMLPYTSKVYRYFKSFKIQEKKKNPILDGLSIN